MTTSGGYDFVESIDPASMRRQLVEAGARLAAARAAEAETATHAAAVARRARRQGWTLEAISGALGITRATVSRWLEG